VEWRAVLSTAIAHLVRRLVVAPFVADGARAARHQRKKWVSATDALSQLPAQAIGSAWLKSSRTLSSSSVLDGAPSFRVGRPAVAPYRPWFAFLPCGPPVLISVWNGMGKCNRADCNHHVSFRTWHFLCKRRRLLEARRRAGIPGRNSRLGLATSPGSGALLSCNHRSNAGSVWLLNIAQEGFFELESLSCLLFSKLCNCEQTRKARPS